MTSFANNSSFTIENNVLKGKVVPHHEEHTSLGEFILSRLDESPDLVGQIDVVTGNEYTYRTMRERSVRCALWLQSQGLRPGDFVVLCTDDHPDYSLACFAIQYLGAISSAWEERMTKEDFSYRMNMTKPKIVFANEGLAAVIAGAAKEAKLDLKIIVFGHVPGLLEFDSIIAEPEIDEVKKFGCVPIQSSGETAVIVYTSGTTGSPKGVVLSHKALAMLSRQAETIGMPGNVCLTFAVTDSITSIESILMHLVLNMPRLIWSPFEEHVMCAAIKKYKVSWLYIEPSIINKLLKSDALGSYDLSSLTRIFHSGNMLPIGSYRAFRKLLPQVQITSGYGTTEVCSYISIQSSKSQPGSCGEILENAQVKVIDPDTEQTLGANKTGELMLKFACMMNCYLDDPQATSEALDEDGWLHSGDLGFYDENSEIFVVDRLKDVIYTADYVDICPSEIENVIYSHSGVKEVAVLGQPQPQDDDLLIAFVVRVKDSSDTNKQVTETEIVDLVAAKLPKEKWLRAGVRFIDHMPRTRTNKIQRRVLRDLARSMVTME